jgi:glycerol transport system permease protein
MMRFRGRSIGIAAYLIILFLPIYWLVNMSFKTNFEITSRLSF